MMQTMKKIFRTAISLLVLFAAASCSKDDAFVSLEETSLVVKASIVQSPDAKVVLSQVANALHPSWEMGDRIIGYSAAGVVSYEVSAIDGEGVATFTKVFGTNPSDGQTAYMVHAPGLDVTDFSNGQLDIDLSNQDGTLEGIRNNNIMCATAQVSGSALNLEFVNQISVMGVEQFTGLDANATYSRFTYSSNGVKSKVKVVDGVMKLVPEAFGAVSINNPDLSSTLYFAIPPVPAESHTFLLVNPESSRVGTISAASFSAGQYYRMATKAMHPALAFDDFEAYTDNVLPAAKYTVNSTSHSSAGIGTTAFSGDRSLLVWSNQWSDGPVMTTGIDYTGAEIITMECYIRTDSKQMTLGLANASCFRIDNIYDQLFSATLSSGLSTTANKWYHVKIRHNTANRDYQVYVDGKLVTSDYKSVVYDRFFFSTLDAPQGLYFQVGGTGSWTKTYAYMDDILLYTESAVGEEAQVRRPGNMLDGVFSVSDTKKVRFSSGYITKTETSGIYSIYSRQYDYASENANVAYDISQNGIDYRWCRLTKEEWQYVLGGRTDAAQKVGGGRVAGFKGVILLPDAFTDPMTNNGNGAFVPDQNDFMTGFGFNANTYTTENWSAMEAAGAVFLRANNETNVNMWTSSKSSGRWDAFRVSIDAENGFSSYFTDISYGAPVRLVMEVKELNY